MDDQFPRNEINLQSTGVSQKFHPRHRSQMGEFIEVRTTEEQQKMLLKQQSPQETLDKLADFMTAAQKKYIDKNGPDTPRPPK